MAVTDHVDLTTFMEGVARRNPGQSEFIQAVQEVAEDIYDFIEDKEAYHREQIEDYVAEYPGATFTAGRTPWGVPCDVALPCATQNELLGDDARALVTYGRITPDYVDYVKGANIAGFKKVADAMLAFGVV